MIWTLSQCKIVLKILCRCVGLIPVKRVFAMEHVLRATISKITATKTKTANRIELRIKLNCLLSHTFASNAYLCILRIYYYGNNVFLLFFRIGTHENISLVMNANGIKYAQHHTHTYTNLYIQIKCGVGRSTKATAVTTLATANGDGDIVGDVDILPEI